MCTVKDFRPSYAAIIYLTYLIQLFAIQHQSGRVASYLLHVKRLNTLFDLEYLKQSNQLNDQLVTSEQTKEMVEWVNHDKQNNMYVKSAHTQNVNLKKFT